MSATVATKLCEFHHLNAINILSWNKNWKFGWEWLKRLKVKRPTFSKRAPRTKKSHAPKYSGTKFDLPMWNWSYLDVLSQLKQWSCNLHTKLFSLVDLSQLALRCLINSGAARRLSQNFLFVSCNQRKIVVSLCRASWRYYSRTKSRKIRTPIREPYSLEDVNRRSPSNALHHNASSECARPFSWLVIVSWSDSGLFYWYSLLILLRNVVVQDEVAYKGVWRLEWIQKMGNGKMCLFIGMSVKLEFKLHLVQRICRRQDAVMFPSQPTKPESLHEIDTNIILEVQKYARDRKLHHRTPGFQIFCLFLAQVFSNPLFSPVRTESSNQQGSRARKSRISCSS